MAELAGLYLPRSEVETEVETLNPLVSKGCIHRYYRIHLPKGKYIEESLGERGL